MYYTMIIKSEQDMLDFGASFAKTLSKSSDSATVLELIGDVGSGKTTFTRGLAAGLNIDTPITSPSFTISKSYALPDSPGRLIHYDFYRLPDPGLMTEDLYENLQNPHNIIVLEWSNSVADILPDDHVTITISYTPDNFREVTI